MSSLIMVERIVVTRRNTRLNKAEGFNAAGEKVCEFPLAGVETVETMSDHPMTKLWMHSFRVDVEDATA